MSSPLFTDPERRGPRAPEPSADSSRPTVTADLERDLLAILAARKERAFAVRCNDLPVVEALALHRRLANPLPDDVLAEPFRRLVVDRRNRILAFLAGARRRAALATIR